MNSEVFELNRIRLERNYTFEVMAGHIGISRRNLFRLFRTPRAQMHDRTRAKINRFITRMRPRRRAGLRRVR